jgi:hypothetical protein
MNKMTLIDLTKDSDLPNLKALRELYDRHFDDGATNNQSLEEIYLSSFFINHIGINLSYFWTKIEEDNNMNVWILIKKLNIKSKTVITENSILESEIQYKAELENKMMILMTKFETKNIIPQSKKKLKVNKVKVNPSGILNIWVSMYKRNISDSLITEIISKTLLNNISFNKLSSVKLNILLCDNILRGGRLISETEHSALSKISYVLKMEVPKLQRINKRVMPLVLKLRHLQNNISKYSSYKVQTVLKEDESVILEENLVNCFTLELKKIINIDYVSIKKDLTKREIPQYLKETKNKYCIFVNVEKDELYQKKLRVSKIYRENKDKEDD